MKLVSFECLYENLVTAAEWILEKVTKRTASRDSWLLFSFINQLQSYSEFQRFANFMLLKLFFIYWGFFVILRYQRLLVPLFYLNVQKCDDRGQRWKTWNKKSCDSVLFKQHYTFQQIVYPYVLSVANLEGKCCIMLHVYSRRWVWFYHIFIACDVVFTVLYSVHVSICRRFLSYKW